LAVAGLCFSDSPPIRVRVRVRVSFKVGIRVRVMVSISPPSTLSCVSPPAIPSALRSLSSFCRVRVRVRVRGEG